jgi:phosphoenolpyruvate carboxykinase (ATP)
MHNLSSDELIAQALKQGEGELLSNGAINVTTGKRTGRSPNDRFIVRDHVTEKTVDWNKINQPISPEKFNALWKRAEDYLSTKKKHEGHYAVGAESRYQIRVKVITELAWHLLFCHIMFLREISNTEADEWTLMNAAKFATDPERDGVNGDAAVILNFSEKKILICGTQYAGEMKKGMFSVLNFLLPEKKVLPMHCSANVGEDGDVALFFGLSGTGKTTLSADPERYLIGDDEHGWSNQGVFNFEGGCYAKCVKLSQKNEPMIWNAITHGALTENIVTDKDHYPLYDDVSLTENTRAAYPLEHIEKRIVKNQAGLPSAVIFLCCDLYGVLPPVARLSNAQAAYYFLSGYTALVGSTEVGQGTGIKPTFSTCFGAPFFSRPPHVYADLLIDHLEFAKCPVYLVNTGWSGGPYGEGGERFAIPVTRAVIHGILSEKLKHADYEMLPHFKFEIPKTLVGVDEKLLDPRKNWNAKKSYDECAKTLVNAFKQNFEKYPEASDKIKQAGLV